MNERTEQALIKMKKYISQALEFSKDYSCDEFVRDDKTIAACVFNISQLGELVKLVDDSVKNRHPEIPWRAIKGMRNRIVHDYEGIEPVIVWNVLKEDFPALDNQIEQLQNKERVKPSVKQRLIEYQKNLEGTQNNKIKEPDRER